MIDIHNNNASDEDLQLKFDALPEKDTLEANDYEDVLEINLGTSMLSFDNIMLQEIEFDVSFEYNNKMECQIGMVLRQRYRDG